MPFVTPSIVLGSISPLVWGEVLAFSKGGYEYPDMTFQKMNGPRESMNNKEFRTKDLKRKLYR